MNVSPTELMGEAYDVLVLCRHVRRWLQLVAVKSDVILEVRFCFE